MKRFIVSLILGLSALSSPAFAWIGGPFDNGFHGAALERNAVYQGTFSLVNGSGYCYFSPTALLAPEFSTGSTATSFDARGSLRNRAVVYYKGITYVGSAFGNVDGEARHITCTMNGNSEIGFSASTTQQQATATTQNQNTFSVASTLVASNRSFTFNGSFEAKIVQTAPSLRFNGTGEFVFLSPTTPDAIAGLAYTGYANLIDAIVAFVAGSRVTTAGSIDYSTVFGGAQNAINNALDTLSAKYLGLGGIDSTLTFGKHKPFRVTGTRRYL